jgi:hypothetical protein
MPSLQQEERRSFNSEVPSRQARAFEKNPKQDETADA